MKAAKLAAVLLLALLALLPSIKLASAVQRPPDSVNLLVKFKPGFRSGARTLQALGASVREEIRQIGVVIASVPRSLAESAKAALLKSRAVDYVEEDVVVKLALAPNDPYYSRQWHLPKIGSAEAWDITTGSQSIIIAVLDTGVDPSHPDLSGKLLQGWNFYDNNADTSDVHGHGTAVAGAAAAISNNGVGVAGAAWLCPILPVRIADSSGLTTYSLLAKGLVYAADRGAKVAVVSFQIFNGSAIASAAKYFVDKGGLVVAAAGNTGKFEGYMDNPYIISVSATSSSDATASFSSYGPYVDISAPGVSIYTTVKGGSYGYWSGTSFSAPIAAGVIALMFSVNPSLQPQQVEGILESTAVDLGSTGYDVYYGWGRVNAYGAVKAAAAAAPAPDAVPPKVEITSPKDGSVVSGTVIVSVSASDNIGVVKVELYKNGVLYAADSESPYEFYWDTTADPDGLYQLAAKAYDAAGNAGASSPVTVKVSNSRDATPPKVSIMKPPDGAAVSKTIDVVVSASDESGISKVELYVDGALVAADASQPYSFRWNTRTVKNGWHTITAKAYDKSGNAAEASIKVYVYNK